MKGLISAQHFLVLALTFSLLGAPRVHAEPPRFIDVARQSGLEFSHFNGMTGELYFVEMMGQGGGVLDYDNDGDQDVYLVQGHLLGDGKTLADTTVPPAMEPPFVDQLFRNDSVTNSDGTQTVKFTNVTAQAGLNAGGYGMGVATGDFDNDGWMDLYVVNFGANQLWRNNRDGTFSDVTAVSGAKDDGWSMGASFFDYDRDGLLDLFIINYVDFSMNTHRPCYSAAGGLEYCGPRSRNAVPDRLLRNAGDGTFEDVTASSGIAEHFGRALGVVAADFNGDGWSDIYVANDSDPNLLWMNQTDGTFENEALIAGAAVNAHGAAEAGMGVDAGDFDGDGDEDLFMTHMMGETNTLYVNDGKGWFTDQTMQTGLGQPSWEFTGFGTGWLDYDNDSILDLVVLNGEVRLIPELVRKGDLHPLRQRNQLYRGLGAGSFEEVTEQAGPGFENVEVSRGAVIADLDNDGDIDIVVTNNSEPVRLLINQTQHTHHWLGLRVVTGDGRDALGARIRVTHSSGEIWRRVRTDGSYLSASDARVLIGLGAHAGDVDVTVHWPTGEAETWPSVKTNQYTQLRQGDGKAVSLTN